jgi:hypothetical protein
MTPLQLDHVEPTMSTSTVNPTAEHTYAVLESPRTLKRRCQATEEQLQEVKRALYNSERRESRAKATVATLLKQLEEKNLLATECQRLLAAFDGLPLELFMKESIAYSEEQRQFATSLHYHSPKAYEFCRQTLKLPAPCTLRRWLSGINYQPGFSEQVFTSLADKVKGPNGWQYKSCSVMIDGMSIRKHVDWDSKQQKMMGFTDLGAGPIDNDSQQEASEALVIMAVGITGHWKVPLGYFLITGISATVQAELIKTAFIKLSEVGIRGFALVMDGHATNQSMVSELGGSLATTNIKTTFVHPSLTDQLVYIFFDACHMIKLLRNALEAVKEIVIPGKGTARWSDIVNLHELQHSEGLRAGNKLTIAHVQFQQQKMKVRLAVQTLSSSVCKALEFLQANRVNKFDDTAGTREYISCIDRLFDIFNSRSPRATGYKKALTASVFQSVKPFLNKCKDMLLSMTDSTGKKICEGRRRTAALGFVVNIESLLLLGDELLLDDTSPYHLKYLLTYKLSQDHLELFFGCIRRMGGWNNNPSAKQFAYSYRALLSRASVTGSIVANVVQQDHTDLLQMNKEPDDEKTELFQHKVFTQDHDYCNINNLSLFVCNVVEYISGWVVRVLSSKVACAECLSALVVQAGSQHHTDSLLEIKNNGGLVRPSNGVIAVIQQAEKVLRETVNVRQVGKDDQWGQKLELKVLASLPTVFQELDEHFKNSQFGIDSHYTDLVRNLCRVYLKLRRHHVINITNQQLRGRSVRQALTKTILFKNQ